jgi:hypothetical protein
MNVQYVKGFYAGIRAARAILRESKRTPRDDQFDGRDFVTREVNQALSAVSEKISNLEPEGATDE